MLSLLRLIVSWVTLFVIGTDLFVVSPLIPSIAGDFQVGTQSAGLTVSIFALGYCLAAPGFGYLADRVGRRGVLTCCLVVFAAANMLTAEATSLNAMLAFRLLCGIAAAGVTPSVYALVGNTAPAGKRGTWIAIVLTGLLSSLPLGASVGVIVSLSVGWSIVFLVLAACSLALAPISQIIWSEFNPVTKSLAHQPDSLNAAMLAQHLLPTVAWSTALYGMYTYLAAGLTSLSYEPERIATIVFIYGACAFAGALLGGRIADRMGPAIAIRVSLTGLCVCFMILRVAVQLDIGVAIAFGVTSLLAQVFFPAQQSLLLSAFPARTATALSWNNSALFLGMGLGALVGGQAMMASGFTAILPVSAAITIAGWAGFLRYQPRPVVPRTT